MSSAQIDFATRHPIRHSYWNQMSDTTVLGAALYTFGIDPNAWYDELDALPIEDMPYDGLPQDFDERIEIICSAVRAELIKKIPNSSHPYVNKDTKIYFKSFLDWFEASPYVNKQTQPQSLSNLTPVAKPITNIITTQPKQTSNILSDFDPLVLDVIAKMFQQDSDSAANNVIWKKNAKNAKRNGLDQARITIGKGTAQSTYDPEKVGEWLISKGKLDQAKLYRILGSNLPARSRDKIDLYR